MSTYRKAVDRSNDINLETSIFSERHQPLTSPVVSDRSTHHSKLSESAAADMATGGNGADIPKPVAVIFKTFRSTLRRCFNVSDVARQESSEFHLRLHRYRYGTLRFGQKPQRGQAKLPSVDSLAQLQASSTRCCCCKFIHDALKRECYDDAYWAQLVARNSSLYADLRDIIGSNQIIVRVGSISPLRVSVALDVGPARGQSVLD